MFGSLSLFDGISTFVGYLIPNLFLKNSCGTIYKEKETVKRVQIRDETVGISYIANALGDGLNPTILLPVMG